MKAPREHFLRVWARFREADDKRKIRMAAAAVGQTMSEFVTRQALEAADKILEKSRDSV